MAGELEPESSAAFGAVVEADAAAHHLDQALADGEAEPGAAFLPRGCGIGLVEAAEDARTKSLRDAGPPVVHRDAQRPTVLLGRNLHHFALGRELGGVREEV